MPISNVYWSTALLTHSRAEDGLRAEHTCYLCLSRKQPLALDETTGGACSGSYSALKNHEKLYLIFPHN